MMINYAPISRPFAPFAVLPAPRGQGRPEATQGPHFSPAAVGNWFPGGDRSFRKSEKLTKGSRFLLRHRAHGGPRPLLGTKEWFLEAQRTALRGPENFPNGPMSVFHASETLHTENTFKVEVFQPP